MVPKAVPIDRIKFEAPGIYKIVVQGSLSENWSDRLAGLRITASTTPKGDTRTSLTGYLRDQAQLSGVLNTLYECHLPIVLVEHLDSSEDDQGDTQ